MTTMAKAVATAVKRGRGSDAYMGTVTAIDATNAALTVDIGTGTPLTGVRWISSYAPTVNDFVVIMRVGTGWWVMGKNSKDLRGGGGTSEGTATATPLASYQGFLVPPWQWSVFDGVDGLRQGRSPGGVTAAGVSVFPNLSALIPAGATITSGKVRTFRLAPGGGGSGGAALVSPAFYGHTYTDIPAGTPSWSTTVWRPGQVAAGQAAQWDLPSAWLTALLAGTMRGIGLYSTAAADWSYWSPPTLTITYTTPA